jgi:Calcium binding
VIELRFVQTVRGPIALGCACHFGLFIPTPMPNPKPNLAREHRIDEEIVVDAYTSDERALGWYYYLEEKLDFPFKAKCVAARGISPLKKGEKVQVLRMAPEKDCMREMFVMIAFAGRRLGAPLAQLEAIDPSRAMREALEDWCYWIAMGARADRLDKSPPAPKATPVNSRRPFATHAPCASAPARGAPRTCGRRRKRVAPCAS